MEQEILFIYLDIFGQTYGWEATREIWEATDGFKTDVEKTLSNYQKTGEVSDDVLKLCMRVLRKYPYPLTIAEEIENCVLGIFPEGRFDYMEFFEDTDVTEEKFFEQQALDPDTLSMGIIYLTPHTPRNAPKMRPNTPESDRIPPSTRPTTVAESSI